jgi:hypothetical protein
MESGKKSQSGFSIVEAVLIVAAIGIIGAAGWFVYQHNRVKVTDAAANPNQLNSHQTPATTVPAVPTVTYLDIKEWGLKLPLSDKIKDAYYVASVSSKGTDGLPNSMLLGLTSFDASSCTADGSNHGQSSAIGAIFRALPTETDPVTGQLLTQEYPNGTTMGSYYYGYESFTNSSGRTCKASGTTLQPIDAAFANAAKKITSASAATN